MSIGSASSLEFALSNFSRARQYLEDAIDQLNMEEFGVINRPTDLYLCQDRDRSCRAHARGFDIQRNKGDLVLKRGTTLTGTRLPLEPLLAELDAIVLEDGENAIDTAAFDVMVFFAAALPASVKPKSVTFYVSEVNGKRNYTIDRKCVPGMEFKQSKSLDMDEVFGDIRSMVTATTTLMTTLKAVGEKRKRVKELRVISLDDDDDEEAEEEDTRTAKRVRKE